MDPHTDSHHDNEGDTSAAEPSGAEPSADPTAGREHHDPNPADLDPADLDRENSGDAVAQFDLDPDDAGVEADLDDDDGNAVDDGGEPRTEAADDDRYGDDRDAEDQGDDEPVVDARADAELLDANDGDTVSTWVDDAGFADHPRPADDGPGTTFAALGLRPELLSALDDLGYEEPTAIQAESIPELIDGRDLLGQAATGTGKTAAFALPLIDQLDVDRDDPEPSALVLVPTRELAIQVSEAIHKYGRRLGVRVVPIYGGQPIHRQFQQLERGVDVVVATPGRALDHIGRGSLPLEWIRTVVLDEADEMLDMGFADDLEAILSATPEDRQTVLFSATMPRRIASLAKNYQRDPVRITIDAGDDNADRVLISQRAYIVQRKHKVAALARILDVESPAAAIVFCRTRGEVDQVAATMNGRGYRAEALHGGMDQQQRDRVMDRLRRGSAELLVATDVAARGIDVDTLTHVVNFDVPSAAESYVHRIGRVGRAGREGTAITLAEPREQRQLANIERHTGQPIELATVPTVDDLRGQRIHRLRDTIVAELDDAPTRNDHAEELLAQLVDDLGADHDLGEITLAALRLAYDSAGADADEPDIPDARRQKNNDRSGRGRDERRPVRSGGSFDDRARENDEATGFLYISLGRDAGVRPGDLVGAIANEVNLSGQQIGPIRVSDYYSVVGIPERTVEQAIAVLNDSSIRGQSVSVRRFVDDGRSNDRRPSERSGGKRRQWNDRPNRDGDGTGRDGGYRGSGNSGGRNDGGGGYRGGGNNRGRNDGGGGYRGGGNNRGRNDDGGDRGRGGDNRGGSRRGGKPPHGRSSGGPGRGRRRD